MAVSRDEDLPSFGPVLPSCAVFQRSQEFRDFLLAKSKNLLFFDCAIYFLCLTFEIKNFSQNIDGTVL